MIDEAPLLLYTEEVRCTSDITKKRIVNDALFRCLCRERDSNPHSRYGQGILSPSCLPFHHRGAVSVCKGSKFLLNNQIIRRKN